LGSLMFGKTGPVMSIVFMAVLFFIFRKAVTIAVTFFQIEYSYMFFIGEVVIIDYLNPIFCWVLMYFVMKKKEAK
jgi:hypothetical protein